MIAGGGPSGLLLGSLLANSANVAILERKRLGVTQKYWVTTDRRLRTHGLQQFVRYRSETVKAGTFLGGMATGRGDLAVADEAGVLGELLYRCRERGATLLENCDLQSLHWERRHVSVNTAAGELHTRLLVDATGGRSPIAATFRLHKLQGFYSVYGAHLRRIHLRERSIVLGYVNQLGDPPPVFEVVPSGSHSAYCVLFVASRRALRPRTLKTLFWSHVERNPFFTAAGERIESDAKHGVIPIGSLRQRSIRGVMPFGEAAMLQPPLLGSAFNEVLEHAIVVAKRILEQLVAEPGIPSMDWKHSRTKRLNDALQRVFARRILVGNTETFDRAVRAVSRLPPELLFRFYSNELRGSDYVKLMPAVIRLITSTAALPPP